MSAKLEVKVEYASLFHNPRYLKVVSIKGTRIRKRDFAKKFNAFIADLEKTEGGTWTKQ
jgi:hypothetical protein